MLPTKLSLVILVMVLSGTLDDAHAQRIVRVEPSANPMDGVPLVLGLDGEGAILLAPVAVFGGMMVYDIATASRSAQWHNLRHPNDLVDPGTATAVSVVSTVVPIVAGYVQPTWDDYLLIGGAVLGPSMGHIYSRRVGRGLATAALRGGFALVSTLVILSSGF